MSPRIRRECGPAAARAVATVALGKAWARALAVERPRVPVVAQGQAQQAAGAPRTRAVQARHSAQDVANAGRAGAQCHQPAARIRPPLMSPMITRVLVLLVFPRLLTPNTANARSENGTTIFRHVSSKFSTCSSIQKKRRHASAKDTNPEKTRRNDGEACLFLSLPEKKNYFGADLRAKDSVYRSVRPSAAPPAAAPAPVRRGERRIHGPRCAPLKSGHITKPTSCVVSPPRPVCPPHRVGRGRGWKGGHTDYT